MATTSVKIGKTKVRINTKQWDKIQKELLMLKNSFTEVGLFSGDNRPDGTPIAAIGFWNEMGTKHIPERPWMRDWIDGNKNKINQKKQELIGKVIDGKISAKKALALLGEFVEAGFKESITNMRTPPNAPSTIRQKGSSNPLIDDGIMRASVKHKEKFRQSRIPK